VFGIDSGVKRSTASVNYQRIRTAASIGQQMMSLSENIHHLCQLSLSTFNEHYRHVLPEILIGRDCPASVRFDVLTRLDPTLHYPVRAATVHPIKEHFRVQLFEQQIKNLSNSYTSNNDDHHQLGEFMFQSHVGYTTCGLDCSETSLIGDLVKQESQKDLIFAAKITGGGGTVAVLARHSLETQHVLERIIARYETMSGRRARLYSGSSSGLRVYPTVTKKK
jgi:galactokinase